MDAGDEEEGDDEETRKWRRRGDGARGHCWPRALSAKNERGS